MAQISVSEDALRRLLREAVADALTDRRDLLREVLTEVLEDVAMAEAIREGQASPAVDRDAVFAALDDPS